MTRVVILMGLRGKSSFSTLPQLIKTGAHCRNQFISITPGILNSLEIDFPLYYSFQQTGILPKDRNPSN